MQAVDRRDIQTLLRIMATLRDPVRGCPWDLEQDFGSIAPFTIEEAYEVADAIDRDDLPELRDELGDLLLQVVFHAQMASEIGAFDFGDVVQAISAKMERRHPHVFGGGRIETAAAQSEAWENLKATERSRSGGASALDGVVLALPALTRAEKLGKRAGRAGLDWADVHSVAAKVREELDEVTAAISAGDDSLVREEIGDLLLACTSLARHCRVDPEAALRLACRKFDSRFRQIEAAVRASGRDLQELTPAELDAEWEAVKSVPRSLP